MTELIIQPEPCSKINAPPTPHPYPQPPVRSYQDPPFINFLVFSEENHIFVTGFKILRLFRMYKQYFSFRIYVIVRFECCLYCFKKFNDRFFDLVFHSIYFPHSVNISFQLSIYQFIFLNLKNLLSHCFSTFSPFHKLQLFSCISKF